MRRSTTVTALIFSSRTLATATIHHRLLTTNSTSYSRWRCFSTVSAPAAATASLGVAGALASAAAIASLSAQSVYAKEPLPTDLVPKEVVLYQYEACPFCNKVKAFLDYYDIPYKVVEVNPINKKEIKWSEYKKVPILMVDGEQLVDSSAIIDQLDQKLTPKRKADSPSGDDEEKKWRGWVDNHLVHLLSPNIYRNTSEALESFDYITSSVCLPRTSEASMRMSFSKVVIEP